MFGTSFIHNLKKGIIRIWSMLLFKDVYSSLFKLFVAPPKEEPSTMLLSVVFFYHEHFVEHPSVVHDTSE